jgi:hypothetical protein
MIILMSYTSHAIQLIYMSCNFKPFKTSFRRGENSAMVRNNWSKPNNILLVGCVNKTFVQELSKHNIKSRFKVTWMQSLNPCAMNDKILPYNYLFRWKKYNLNDEVNGSHRWGKEFIVASFMNITWFFFQ